MTSPIILVLDDEPGIALLCHRLLTRAGFDVLPFTEPLQAIAELERREVDLLLVDIRMPQMDGFEMIQRARSIQPDLAVLVMTGYGTVETAIRALRQGVDGLLLKPFEQGEELIASVRQALADNQNKRDALRIQTLRPLFNVTEALFSETQTDPLVELILEAVVTHLRCAHSALYRFDPTHDEFILMAAHGVTLLDGEEGQEAVFADAVRGLETSLVVNAAGPGEPAQRSELTRRGLVAAMFLPVTRLAVRHLLYAARDSKAAPFGEADLDLFQILARQAAIALENARLYSELRDYVHRVEESQQALLQAEKMATAGRLTASIAHEINNPLQGVQNCIHLAARADLPAEKRQEYFDLARSELDRLQTTVQRMLDFYRPNAILPQPVNVAVLLAHVLTLLGRQLDERDIAVERNFSPTLPDVHVVASQIQQVFINLILNAYDAMPEGGRLSVSARAVRAGVETLVQDSGPGISAEAAGRIFEPFVSTKTGGTGLGLTVSYNIIVAHGGRLELVSSARPGACFRVFLPFGGIP
ncbi:MAG: Adaptive-response sensory-kinase SasA [Anaerolineales bacterium]|nr:Adaptive-response sensory-kinase SasA [Anaerolineales bacterium]